MASMQKLGKTGLQTLREDNGVTVRFFVTYNGARLGYFWLRKLGVHRGKYVAHAYLPGDTESDRPLVGMFDPKDYKSRHACRKAAAEAIVVAHDKLLDGEPL